LRSIQPFFPFVATANYVASCVLSLADLQVQQPGAIHEGVQELVFAPDFAGSNVSVELTSFKSETNSAGGWLGSPAALGKSEPCCPDHECQFFESAEFVFHGVGCVASGRLAVISVRNPGKASLSPQQSLENKEGPAFTTDRKW
jgi:hypothetical protein